MRFWPDLISSSSSSNSRTAIALSAGPAGDGDLVAADVDVGVEPRLDDAQQFVAGAEQGDHRLLTGHDEGRGDAIGVRRHVGTADRSRCAFWSAAWYRPLYRRREPPGCRIRRDQPGGQPIGRPASTCACTWKTLWPDLGAGVEDGAEVGQALLLGHRADAGEQRRPRPAGRRRARAGRGSAAAAPPARASAPAGRCRRTRRCARPRRPAWTGSRPRRSCRRCSRRPCGQPIVQRIGAVRRSEG